MMTGIQHKAMRGIYAIFQLQILGPKSINITVQISQTGLTARIIFRKTGGEMLVPDLR